jgi:valyl-tRNA synthetase
MNGRDALWQSGTDHAGIATQMVVERQTRRTRHLTRHDSRPRKVRRKNLGMERTDSGGTITQSAAPPRCVVAIGARERFTMGEGLCRRRSARSSSHLFKQGLIYKDKRLVNWDPKLHTAISDLEVEQRETKGQMWHFKYPVEGQEGDVCHCRHDPARNHARRHRRCCAPGRRALQRNSSGRIVYLPIANRPQNPDRCG